MTATPSSREVTSTTNPEPGRQETSPAPECQAATLTPERQEEPYEEPQEIYQPSTPPETPPPIDRATRIQIRMQRPRTAQDIEITVPVIRVANQRNSLEINISIDFEPENNEAQGASPV